MKLNADERQSASSDTQAVWSNRQEACPMLASEITDLVGQVDDEIDQAEKNIHASIPDGPIKDWLLADRKTTREIFTIVSRHRVQASGTNPED